jgi:hypothetical protein
MRFRMGESDDVEAMELRRRLDSSQIDAAGAASAADEAVKRLAEQIVQGRVDPMRGAMAIYNWAQLAGAWDETQPLPELQSWGAEFLQLADALERLQDNAQQRAGLESLIVGCAKAAIDDVRPPDWTLDARGHLVPPDQ